MEHRFRSRGMWHCIVKWVPNVTASHCRRAHYLSQSCPLSTILFLQEPLQQYCDPTYSAKWSHTAGFPVRALCAFRFPHHMSQCALFIASSLICSPEQYLITNTDHEPTFSLCNCFLLPVTSFFLCPVIFFTTRLFYTLSCCSSHNVRGQVSHLFKLIGKIIVCIFWF